MKSAEIRNTFLRFFESKRHSIVPSAPMVVKNDPTLMFTNAGMNQFKDIFLGNSATRQPRIADTQKCLRVSGKHNDLEEVGHDTYHHTMFEMLGNWSFGDYFKKEAIAWAWELLTEVYKIDKDDLYVTVFGGDKGDGLPVDEEAFGFWKAIIPEDRILFGSKKDNFWEMGDTGPCGPCSEIHVDIRSRSEKESVSGRVLVNTGNPLVIEIWNLVFIEFNRKSDGSLVPLPARHIDTGMGFERLCMVLQKVKSNYDTDVFQPLISQIGQLSGKPYGGSDEADIAMRVIADHLRAISFAIADGQLPSNNKAGYVIRRILRRAVRYGFTFLGFREPFLCTLVPSLTAQMGDVFPELTAQKELITNVIREEEQSFLRTLETGIHRFDIYKPTATGMVDGKFAFELFDTYGFPVDLTQLMAREKGLEVDMDEFGRCMEEQKKRSRQAAAVDKDDWVLIDGGASETEFTGYTNTSEQVRIVRYRKVKAREREMFQIVLDRTPFYAESGGQVGDSGVLQNDSEHVPVEDTQKENNLIIHITPRLPLDTGARFIASVDVEKRLQIRNNHTATHLLHKALREVLGTHVEQKGSLVSADRLRFDFSHFAALGGDEIRKIECRVFEQIMNNHEISTSVESLDEARQKGAVALFGEKYSDKVRVVTIGGGYSLELCGGTHAEFTGQIGLFVIVLETAVAAGVRRIEAITGRRAFDYLKDEYVYPMELLKELLKKPLQEISPAVHQMNVQNLALKKQIEDMKAEQVLGMKDQLKASATDINGVNFVAAAIQADAGGMKDLAYRLRDELPSMFLLLASENDGKALLTLMISDELTERYGWDASALIREFAKEIQGGGGGQKYFATAGGKNPGGIMQAIDNAREKVLSARPKQ